MKKCCWRMWIGFVCVAVLIMGAGADASPLSGLKICLDPGHGNTTQTDSFRVGPGGEREEWVNLRVGRVLRDLLREAGVEVFMTRETDTDVNLAGRAALAKLNDCDLFISIHHNGTSNDPEVDFPLIYFWGKASENSASVDLGRHVMEKMLEKMEFEDTEGAGLYSDFLIYPQGTSVLRNSYPELPGIIGEAGYFTNADAEARMKDPAHNRAEAEAFFEGILEYASKGIPKATLVQPGEKDRLGPKNLEVVFQLSDGLGGHDFQPDTLAATVEGQRVSHGWNPETGKISFLAPFDGREKVEVTVEGRSSQGNALHPRQWVLKTWRAWPKAKQGEWRTAYEQARRLQASAMIMSNPYEWDRMLREATAYYQRSVDVAPHHPYSASAEFHIAQCYEQLSSPPGDPLARAIGLAEGKERAIHFYTRVVEYYPMSEAARPARESLSQLQAGGGR